MQVGALAQGYLDAGGSVQLICIDSALPAQPRLSVRAVSVPRRPFVLSSPWFILRASWETKRHGRGLIHATGALLIPRCDVSTVHFCHTAYARRDLPIRASRDTRWHHLNARLTLVMNQIMERWCYRPSRVRVLVGPSPGVARELAEFFPQSRGITQVIHNGIDHDRFTPSDPEARRQRKRDIGLSPDAFVAVFVGGDWRRKGLERAIRALGQAQEWHLLVVGDGEPEPFEAIAREVGAAERVSFLGRASEVERIYQAGDAFVFPSDYEVAPVVTYEAAACGLPLVVTRVNGTEDLVIDGENGWFVESPDDIAASLRELSNDADLRERMGESARKSSADFGWAPMIESYKRLYHSLDR